MSLRLVRLPRGAWSLVAVPDSQHVEAKRAGVAPEVVCPCTVDVLARAASALGVRS